MIVSSENSRLKRARKLQARKWREKEGAFVTEGEDLLAAGRAVGVEPIDVLVAPGSGIEGEEVEPALLDGVSSLGSGTRVIAVWPLAGAEPPAGQCVYLHGVADPGNVGTIVRTAAALTGARVVLGPGSADAYSPKGVRATMGAIFSSPPSRGALADTARPRLALVAHGGEDLDAALAALDSPPTLCLGGEREGLPWEIADQCDARVTIALRPGSESLNVAAAAAIGLQRISSLKPGGGGR